MTDQTKESERDYLAEKEMDEQINLVHARLLGMIAFKHDFSLDPFADQEFVGLLTSGQVKNPNNAMTAAWVSGWTSVDRLVWERTYPMGGVKWGTDTITLRTVV